MFKSRFKLFKESFSKPTRPQAQMRDLKALASGLTRPAIQVTVEKSGGRSHFGGNPGLPEGVAWPQQNGRQLEFLARVSLQEVQQTLAIDWLPQEGALLFFYDIEEQPSGYQPEDQGGWAVLHVPDGDAEPEPGSQVPFKPIGFRKIESYPSSERDEVVALSMKESEIEAYVELTESQFEGGGMHQISGYPRPIQHDDMECQSAIKESTWSGLRADARHAAIRSAAKKWGLLFQIDSDDDLGFCWGDCGILYFWVEEEAARRGDFSNVWLVLQCT